MRVACLALLLVAFSDIAFAQATGGAGSAPAPAPSPAPPPAPVRPPGPAASQSAPSPAEPAPAPTPEGLLSGTLGDDIASASYYELVSWCRRLRLDDSGSRKDLQNRLADHYKVKLPLEAIKGKRIVTVKSAKESLYYTLPDVNEKYVVLRGGVDIEVRDTDRGSVQEIKADSVTYNQTRHTISADGDVSYTISKGKESQNYTGSRFSFDLDSSEGVFYDGATTKEVTQADQKLTYYFQGTTISRLSNNTVIMQNGSFTTSQPVDPFWQVRAKDVWILAPSEWAADSAVLMVGRVPLLYFPAFFWPGDELFFNPNPGYDNRTGAFVQTTTYLLGRKTKQDNPFSFLQISETGETAYKEELRGLFLRKIPGESPPPDNGQKLKLLLDLYSRLGAFAGMSGDFPPLASFRVGLGFSRSVFLFTDSSGAQYYTPYFYDSNASAVTGPYWNTSSFFGILLPFRFGIDGSIQSTADPYSLSWKFAYYSDPTFIADFYTRNEGINFSAVLQPTTNPVQTAATATQPNLSWDYVSKLDLTKIVKSPYIQSISFPTLNMNMTWQSKDLPGASDPTSALYWDPGHTFYYPSSITFPNVAFSVSGEILKVGAGAAASPSAGAQPQTPAASAGQTSQAAQPGASAPAGAPGAPGQNQPPAQPEVKDPGKGIRTPLAPKPQEQQPKKPGRSIYREAALWPDANPTAPGLGSSLDVTYQMQPRATLQSQFDNTYWTSPQAIDYSVQYMTIDTGGSGQLTAASSLWDRLADVSTTFAMDGEFRQHFNPDQDQLNSTGQNGQVPTWQSLLQGDLLQDRLTLQGILQSTLRPLLGVPSWTGST
ncbi:MAG TPA: hypothetical protein VMU36_04930, partial [Spirochaetia bacterium]|nr:hypothetical protein [Spirochaetia bacterium]